MLSESLVVVDIADDQQSVHVLGARQTACGSCSAKLGCGHGMLYSHGSSQTFTLPLNAPPASLVAGDSIRLMLPASVLLSLAFGVYARPLLMALFLATAAALLVPAQTGLQVAALLVGLALGVKRSVARSAQKALAERLEISKCSHKK